MSVITEELIGQKRAGVPEPGLRGGVQVPMAQAFVGSNPTPRTTYGKTLRGFSRVMWHLLSVTLGFSEDFSAVEVFACHVLETSIY